MHAPFAGPTGTITLFPRRHVRRQVGKTLGHLVPAVLFVLSVRPLFAGTEPLTLLAGLEVVVGLTYLVLIVQELRHLRHSPFHPGRIAWLEGGVAAILALESYHLWHRHHAAELAGASPRLHLLPWLYATVALLYVILAFGFQAITQRRYLQLSADGFAVRTRLFAPVRQVRWSELTAVEPVGPSAVRLRYREGHEHLLSFDRFAEGLAHRDRLLVHAQAARSSQA